MLRLTAAFRCAQPILGGTRGAIPSQHPHACSVRAANGLSAAKRGTTGIDRQRWECPSSACPYAPPIDPIFGSGIAIMPPARIPGRLTSRCLISSTCGAIFCQGDPHRGAVWLVGNIPPGKLHVCFDNLSMHSCVPDRMSELPHVSLRADVHRPRPSLPIGGGDDQNQGREPNERDEA